MLLPQVRDPRVSRRAHHRREELLPQELLQMQRMQQATLVSAPPSLLYVYAYLCAVFYHAVSHKTELVDSEALISNVFH